jgi:hypothetical protein
VSGSLVFPTRLPHVLVVIRRCLGLISADGRNAPLAALMKEFGVNADERYVPG